MAHFEASLLTVAAAPGVAYAQLQHQGGAGTARMRVRELTWTTQNATQSPVGLIRASTTGVPSGAQVGLATDDVENTIANGALLIPGVGGNAPQIAVTPRFFRKFYAAAVAGSGIPWFWANGELTISPGGALLIWNFDLSLTGSILALSAKWEE